MKFPLKQRVLWPVLTVCLSAVLIALGVLQYRWSTEVSNAASARMRAVLSSSMLDFQRDLMREISSVTSAFPAGEQASTSDLSKFADSIRQWQAATDHAGMMKALYVLQGKLGAQPEILRFDSQKSMFVKTEWPSELAALHESFADPVAISHYESRGFHRGREFGGPGPLRERPRVPGPPGQPPPEHHGPPWFIDSSIPALIHPMGIPFPDRDLRRPAIVGIIVELDRQFFGKHLFPELAQRYFPVSDALGYDVTVLGGASHSEDIYSSSAQLAPADTDATLDLLASSGGRASAGPVPHFRNGPDMAISAHAGDVPWGTPLVFPGANRADNWRLLVKNRQGSLEAVVERLRSRNLALSFGILLILAATMGMLILASRRALRLAQLQMDFVAGVSHELRTPVTVISSAAENIADGVVQDKEQLARYGKAIRTQANQLQQLIEQVLQFAAIGRNKNRSELQQVEINTVIDAVLNRTAEVVHNAGFRVETSIQPDLPTVMADAQALSQALQNLVTNAVKYGGEAGWIGVSAAVRQIAGGSELLITVADRGMGIASDEIKQIFDAFYRGTEARAAQIHGSGLGLPLAKSMIEAMNGEITVESQPGRGSSFTIHLPMSTTASSRVSAVAPVNPNASYSKS